MASIPDGVPVAVLRVFVGEPIGDLVVGICQAVVLDFAIVVPEAIKYLLVNYFRIGEKRSLFASSR